MSDKKLTVAESVALVLASPSSIFTKEDVIKILMDITTPDEKLHDTDDMAQAIVNMIDNDARSYDLSLSGSEINVELNENFVHGIIQEFLESELYPITD
jgi:hypothetical protein